MRPFRIEILRLAPLIPALAIVLVWLPSLSGSFQFDDWNVIVNEPRVHSLSSWWASMPGIRPLLKFSYALSYAISTGPLGFRIVNVLIHALNASLAFQILRMLGVRSGLTDSEAARAALLAALIFALHPVQTEAVTYISGRSTSLAACFCLVSLLCWARGHTIACCVAYVAAVASKEPAIVLPLALGLYSADRPARETLRRLLPVIGVALALLAIVVAIPMYRHLLAVSLETRTIGENLLTQAQGVTYLAGQMVRPWNGNADPHLAAVGAFDAQTIVLAAIWAAALVAGLVCVRRARVGAFAVLWFLLWLAPTNSLLPRLDPVNDRQLYLALLGPAWWLAVHLTKSGQLWRWRALASAAVVAVLCVATIQRNTIYETEVSFWEDTAARNPSSSRAANNLGMAYAMACRRADALAAFSHAIALDGRDYQPRINRVLLQANELPGVACESVTSPAGSPFK